MPSQSAGNDIPPEVGLTVEYQANAQSPLQRQQLDAGIAGITVEYLDSRTNRWYPAVGPAGLTPPAMRLPQAAAEGELAAKSIHALALTSDLESAQRRQAETEASLIEYRGALTSAQQEVEALRTSRAGLEQEHSSLTVRLQKQEGAVAAARTTAPMCAPPIPTMPARITTGNIRTR